MPGSRPGPSNLKITLLAIIFAAKAEYMRIARTEDFLARHHAPFSDDQMEKASVKRVSLFGALLSQCYEDISFSPGSCGRIQSLTFFGVALLHIATDRLRHCPCLITTYPETVSFIAPVYHALLYAQYCLSIANSAAYLSSNTTCIILSHLFLYVTPKWHLVYSQYSGNHPAFS